MGAEHEREAGARETEAAAEVCLRGSSELADYPITCEFREGTLTLRGRVPTYFLKQAARSLAREVRGVRAVDNRIDVIPVPISEEPSDDARRDAGEDRGRTD